MPETPRSDATHVDLTTLLDGQTGPGAVWSHATTDLNLNLVVYAEGSGVLPHVNAEVDVLLVAVEGRGRVIVGDVVHVISAGQMLVVPKGTRREISALSGRFGYLTCHRRRPSLWPINAPRPATEKAG